MYFVIWRVKIMENLQNLINRQRVISKYKYISFRLLFHEIIVNRSKDIMECLCNICYLVNSTWAVFVHVSWVWAPRPEHGSRTVGSSCKKKHCTFQHIRTKLLQWQSTFLTLSLFSNIFDLYNICCIVL